MLNLICGADTAQEGKILFEGKDITGLSEHRRAKFIGRVFQAPKIGTCAGLTILENMALTAMCIRDRNCGRKRNDEGRNWYFDDTYCKGGAGRMTQQKQQSHREPFFRISKRD